MTTLLTLVKRWQGMVKKQLTDVTEEKILEVLEAQEVLKGKSYDGETFKSNFIQHFFNTTKLYQLQIDSI